MRHLLIGMVVVVACACGGKKEDKPASAGGETGTAAATSAGTAKASGTAAPPAAGTCQAACERRKECGVTGADDVAACTADCSALSDVFTADVLAAFTKAACPEVAQAETSYRGAVACKKACAKRAECLGDAAKDQKKCLGDCTALAVVSGENGVKTVDDYTAGTCDQAKQVEPAFQMSAACVSSCKHALGCGVAGTFPGCIAECGQALQQSKLTVDQLAAIEKASCDEVKKTVTLASATQPAPAAAGGSCDAMCKNVASCKIASYEGCMKDCPSLNQERVGLYSTYTCDQLRNPPIPNVGCMREGIQDCQPGMMCCASSLGRAALQGEQGQCLYAALCYR